jgi:pimeloyl-ACP methyl ester carboxylesterase
MGHSWGTYLGVKTIEKYPENYMAYIGIGQVSNQTESEKLAYDYMLQHATEINDKSALKDLQKFDKNATDFPSFKYLGTVRSLLMNEYGIGFTHVNSLTMANWVKILASFKGYTLREKINYIRGALFSLTHIWDYVLADNLFESSTAFQIPVYITHGKYDYQVSYSLSLKYFDKIDAPDKQFFTFENSAHSPIMEESEKFVGIVREMAGGKWENRKIKENK